MIKLGRRSCTTNGIIFEPRTPPLDEGKNGRSFRRIRYEDPLSEFSCLGPYSLKDRKNRLIENVWQFSKIYTFVPGVKFVLPEDQVIKKDQPISRRRTDPLPDPIVLWSHPWEKHVNYETQTLTTEWWEWRKKGFRNPYPIRNPTGLIEPSSLLWGVVPVSYSLPPESIEVLGLVEGRKEIYLKNCLKYLEEVPELHILRSWLLAGQNLFLVSIDGPHFESLEYYQDKYGVEFDFISNDNVATITPESLEIFLNDKKHPFGYGYCLAASILNYKI